MRESGRKCERERVIRRKITIFEFFLLDEKSLWAVRGVDLPEAKR